MKTETQVTPAISIMLAFVLSWSVSFRAEAIDAVVTYESGKKTSVTGLRALRTSKSYANQVYLGIPTTTTAYLDSIILSVDAQYQVEIPLDIIKSVARDKAKEIEHGAAQFVVVLSDGTSLSGQLGYFSGSYPEFTGKTELGDFENSWQSLAEIAFSSPKTAFHAKANGRRSLTFYATDADKRSLSGAAFVIEDTNKNGCFTGLSYPETIRGIGVTSSLFTLLLYGLYPLPEVRGFLCAPIKPLDRHGNRRIIHAPDRPADLAKGHSTIAA
jgi:hypothetical protein